MAASPNDMSMPETAAPHHASRCKSSCATVTAPLTVPCFDPPTPPHPLEPHPSSRQWLRLQFVVTGVGVAFLTLQYHACLLTVFGVAAMMHAGVGMSFLHAVRRFSAVVVTMPYEGHAYEGQGTPTMGMDHLRAALMARCASGCAFIGNE